jgi:hypothetical protein
MDNLIAYVGVGNTIQGIAPYTDENWTYAALNLPGAPNGNSAYVAGAAFDTGKYSTILYGYSYTFAFPAALHEVQIAGIEVEIKKYHANGDMVDGLLQFSLNGIDRSGDDKADGSTHWPDANTVVVYGGPTDLWGINWTQTILRNPSFGVHFVCKAHADDADGYVDSIGIRVYYELLGESRVHHGRRTRFSPNIFGDIVAVKNEWRLAPQALPLVAQISNTIAAPSTSVAAYTDAGAITISIASPGIVSKVGHGLADTREIWIKTSGALPTGLTQYTHYYVKYKDADSFWLAATSGGASINTSGSQSGTHNLWTKD